MWSLYDLIWERALPDFLRGLKVLPAGEDFVAGRVFFGRPYWNLGAVKRCLARLPGFVERDFDEDLSVAIDYEGPGLVTPFTLMGILRAIPTALAMGKIFDRQAAFDTAFLDPEDPKGFEALLAPWVEVPPGSTRRRSPRGCATWSRAPSARPSARTSTRSSAPRSRSSTSRTAFRRPTTPSSAPRSPSCATSRRRARCATSPRAATTTSARSWPASAITRAASSTCARRAGTRTARSSSRCSRSTRRALPHRRSTGGLRGGSRAGAGEGVVVEPGVLRREA